MFTCYNYHIPPTFNRCVMEDDNKLVRKPEQTFAQSMAQKTATSIAQIKALEYQVRVMREALEKIAAGSNEPQSEAKAALEKLTKP